jgi:hypothetical protein
MRKYLHNNYLSKYHSGKYLSIPEKGFGAYGPLLLEF